MQYHIIVQPRAAERSMGALGTAVAEGVRRGGPIEELSRHVMEFLGARHQRRAAAVARASEAAHRVLARW